MKLVVILSLLSDKPVAGRRLKQAKSLPIVVNGYILDVSNAVDLVYKYEVKFLGIKKDGKEKDLSRGPKNE